MPRETTPTPTPVIPRETTPTPTPVIPRETTPTPTPVIPRETIPTPTPVIPRETIPTPTPVIPRETTPTPTPVIPRETTPTPTPVIPRETTPTPTPVIPRETTQSQTIPARNYIGVAGNFGLSGDSALGENAFTVFSKIGLTNNFSFRPVAVTEDLVPSHLQLMEKMAAAWWVDIYDYLKLPILQLCGNEVASKRPIAAVACNYLELNLYADGVTLHNPGQTGHTR
ncbi:MAG: hypothetical protein ACHBN1_35490 [Heteroscytonema crispum UTEX LB 1556]